jgi:hypothetical protein
MSRNARGSARSSPAKNFDAAILKAFQKFREPEANNDDEAYIGVDGLEKLCDEMGIDPLSRVLILLQKECGCATMGEITQNEFLTGMKTLGFDDDEFALKKVGTKLKNSDRALGHSSATSGKGAKYVFHLPILYFSFLTLMPCVFVQVLFFNNARIR